MFALSERQGQRFLYSRHTALTRARKRGHSNKRTFACARQAALARCSRDVPGLYGNFPERWEGLLTDAVYNEMPNAAVYSGQRRGE